MGFLALVVTLSWTPLARAGFVVNSLDLADSVTDTSQGPADVDFEIVDTLTNPLNHDSLAQIGMNIVESTYAFQWNETSGTGTFNSDFTHAIRSVDVRTATVIQVFIEPSEDLRVTLEGSLTYAHTPSREFAVLYGMAVRDLTNSMDVLRDTHNGGTLMGEPASGTFDIGGEAILQPGRLYRLQAVLDNTNLAEPNVGDLDASGFANYTIAPLVPEPTSATLILLVTPCMLRRRKRSTRT